MEWERKMEVNCAVFTECGVHQAAAQETCINLLFLTNWAVTKETQVF